MTPMRLFPLWAGALVAVGCGGESRPREGSLDAGPRAGDGFFAPDALADSTATMDGSSADGAFSCDGPGARFITDAVAHQFGPGQNTGQNLFPTPIYGPPKGGGACQGSTDVVSLGNGGSVTVAFGGNEIIDGPGTDFLVFENPFGVGCNLNDVYAELATVSVSEDGITFVEFPCTATAAPYGLCAGWHPVFANADTNTIDPLDPTVAGGDPYDLADVGLSRARFVRIVDRVDLTTQVFDLDAVGIVHAACP